MLMNLESADTTNKIFDVLQFAEEAGHDVSRDVSDFEGLYDKIDEQKDRVAEMNAYFEEKGKIADEEEILKELEEMEV